MLWELFNFLEARGHIRRGRGLDAQDAWVLRMQGDDVDEPEQVLTYFREGIPMFDNRGGIPERPQVRERALGGGQNRNPTPKKTFSGYQEGVRKTPP